MNRVAVQSSSVAEVGYDPSAQILEVLFLNGHLYQYFDVPAPIYNEMIGSESVGKYLNSNVIRGGYRYARL